jgi:2-polyprenyl-6-methoxyphenol hydroxylase-like FAD-dependent oxidoreductase
MDGIHALVVGAGIAGLAAARVLAETYDQVTVVDRDTLPPHGGPRAGVPQGQHVHAVLMLGAAGIRELFPGLVEELVAEGVPMGDILAGARPYFGPHRLAPAPSGLLGLCVARPHLEYRIRMRLGELPNVRFVAGRTVVGLKLSPDRTAVTGVRTTNDDGSADDTDADLVVDASGRGSRLPQWLVDVGYPSPHQERIRVDIAYTSAMFSMPADVIGGDLGVAVAASPSNPRGGALINMGNEQWLVSLNGYRDAHPPVGFDGFTAFARQLAVPDIAEALRVATPTGTPTRFRIPDATRRHYEKLTRFPAGLVVLGDAVSCFNPVYGQGMSVAIQEALVLRQRIREAPPHGTSLRGIQRDIARTSAVAWTMSVSNDLRMPWIRGRRTASVRLGNAYLARLYRAASVDPVVALAFMRVANLIDPPSAILRPSIARRVLIRGRAAASAGRGGPG